MKKVYAISILFLISAVTSAYSLPILQLDAEPGEYIGGTEESTVATSKQFTLSALLDNNQLTNYADYQFYVSVALTPKTGEFSGGNFGSFDFNGSTVNVTNDMTWGTPPMDAAFEKSNDLPSHGIYDTWYAEFALDFSAADLVDAYNVQTDEPKAGDQLLSLSYLIDLSNLGSGFGLHFDLYGFMMDGGDAIVKSLINAPFSHDVSTSVPEPSTILLLGIGLVGIAGMSRRKLMN